MRHTGHIAWQKQTCSMHAGLLLLLGVWIVALSRTLFGACRGCQLMPAMSLDGWQSVV